MKHLKRIHTLPMKLYFSYLEVMQPTPKLLTNFSKLFIQILISKQHFEFNQTLVVEGNAPAVRKYLLLPSFVNLRKILLQMGVVISTTQTTELLERKFNEMFTCFTVGTSAFCTKASGKGSNFSRQGDNSPDVRIGQFPSHPAKLQRSRI